jgi:putative transposase
MPNTYTQLNVHSVFCVKGRENIITKKFRDDLHRYISGTLKNNGTFPLAVGGWKDHVHLFFELPPIQSVAKQMQMLKASSSRWINENRLVLGKFQWQEGYAAFTPDFDTGSPKFKTGIIQPILFVLLSIATDVLPFDCPLYRIGSDR